MEATDILAIICFACEGICFIWFVTTLFMEFIMVRNIIKDNRKELIKSFDPRKTLILSSYKSRTRSLNNGNDDLIGITVHKLSNISIRTIKEADSKYIALIFSKFVFTLIVLFGVVLMCCNKLYYKFWKHNIWFISASNFDYFNNIHKILVIFTICYLWNCSLRFHSVKKTWQRLLYYDAHNIHSVFFDRIYVIILISFLLSWNLSYIVVIKDEKWNNWWNLAEASCFNMVFTTMIVFLSLSLDFNLISYYSNSDRIVLYLQIGLINLLLLVIIIEAMYNILVYIIDTETYSYGLSPFSSTAWNFYGFSSNYLLVRINKVLFKKILFHQISVQQPKGIKLIDKPNDGSISRH